MDPGSGDMGGIDYSGLPGNTFGVATMVDMDEASKPKSAKNTNLHANFTLFTRKRACIFLSYRRPPTST